MTTLQRCGASLWTRGMIAVLIAQLLSAMADNALLFAALALLKSKDFPVWAGPLLQEFFAGAFILLAPFVGPFADSNPKGRVMLLANGLKLAGTLGMCLGLNPLPTAWWVWGPRRTRPRNMGFSRSSPGPNTWSRRTV
jgi:LPLT family lysophospholipid transporter-like MFS transporter